jgi:hypothetical protein
VPDLCPGETGQVGGHTKRPILRRLGLVPAVVICAVSLTAASTVLSSVAWGSTPPPATAASAAPSGSFSPMTAWN